jgi:hypothetical protein
MTRRDLASSERSLSFSYSSSLTLALRGLVFGPRFLERASWLCWLIILRHSVIWDEKSPSRRNSAPFPP